jgi:hypothetical protein
MNLKKRLVMGADCGPRACDGHTVQLKKSCLADPDVAGSRQLQGAVEDADTNAMCDLNGCETSTEVTIKGVPLQVQVQVPALCTL